MEDQSSWQKRIQSIFQTCQDEVKKTTEIGKKMLSASKTNSSLHDAYKELGQLAAKAIERGEIKWDAPKVAEILETIKTCEKDLEHIESDVNKIKFSSNQE